MRFTPLAIGKLPRSVVSRPGPMGTLVSFLAGLLLGLFIGFVGRDFFSLTFKHDFDIADIGSLLVGFLIVFVLQFHLPKIISEKRVEKEIIISEIRKLFDFIEEVQQKVESCQTPSIGTPKLSLMFQETTKLFKEIGMKGSQIATCAEIYEMKGAKHFFENTVHKSFLNYKRSVTGRAPSLGYTADEMRMIKRAYDDFYEKIHELIRVVNRE